MLARIKADCDAFAAGSGALAANVEVAWSAEARYTDQAWEIEVPLRKGSFGTGRDLDALVEDFHQMHQDVFAVSDPGAGIEVVSWDAEVRCRIGSGKPGRLARDDQPAKLPMRSVRFIGSDWADADVHRLESMPQELLLSGPAVVESDFTSIVVDSGATAWRDGAGNLVIGITG